jgi:hypothetical protein
MTRKKIKSTDDFDPKKFRPHGRVTFTQDGNLLICEAQGPFNKELLEAIADIELSLVYEMQKCGQWADIIVIKENAMASSECLEAFTEYLSTLGRANLHSLVTAMVIGDDVISADVMTNQFINAYTDAGLNLTVFKTLNDAKVFVKLHL